MKTILYAIAEIESKIESLEDEANKLKVALAALIAIRDGGNDKVEVKEEVRENSTAKSEEYTGKTLAEIPVPEAPKPKTKAKRKRVYTKRSDYWVLPPAKKKQGKK